MTSETTGDTISEGFRQMAAYIDSKIRSRGNMPAILGYSKYKKGDVTLFRGPLGLSEIYYFGPRNIFFADEGIAIENNNETEIFFKYSDNNEAVWRFSETAGLLSGMSRFSDFKMTGEYTFELKDIEGRVLSVSVSDSCLHVTIRQKKVRV
jgi:hypothetical protein